MGLIQQEIKELRQLLGDVKGGKVTHEQLMDQIAVYSQIEKRAQTLLNSISLAAKYGSSTLRRVINTNIIGNEEAIDLALDYQGNEKVMCEVQEKVISRDECLDFSGNPPEGVNCSGCKHFKITRQKLLPKTM